MTCSFRQRHPLPSRTLSPSLLCALRAGLYPDSMKTNVVPPNSAFRLSRPRPRLSLLAPNHSPPSLFSALRPCAVIFFLCLRSPLATCHFPPKEIVIPRAAGNLLSFCPRPRPASSWSTDSNPGAITKRTICSLHLTNSNNLLHCSRRLGRGPVRAPAKSCASVAQRLKSQQNPQSHPDYHFIKATLFQPIQNQHFRNC